MASVTNSDIRSRIMHLPETGFLRVPQILAIIPIGRTAWWDGVKSGRFPKSVKLGPRTTAWRVEDIKKLVESFGAEG